MACDKSPFVQKKVCSVGSLAEPSPVFAISSLPWFEVLGGVAFVLGIPNVFGKVVGDELPSLSFKNQAPVLNPEQTEGINHPSGLYHHFLILIAHSHIWKIFSNFHLFS